jgi:MFS family permease
MPDNDAPLLIHRFRGDFWKFWAGQTISTFGSSFTSFALPLLIYKLTGSALNLSFTVVATVLPYILFGLVIGAWTDRVNRKRLMVWADLGRVLTFIRVLTWSTASIGALLGGFAIEQTQNVGLVYGAIGMMVLLAACAFILTPLRAAEHSISRDKSNW